MSILVFVEHHDGTIAPGSLGVLGAARELASTRLAGLRVHAAPHHNRVTPVAWT